MFAFIDTIVPYNFESKSGDFQSGISEIIEG